MNDFNNKVEVESSKGGDLFPKKGDLFQFYSPREMITILCISQ